MSAFLCTYSAITIVVVLSRLLCLASGRMPRHTPGAMAFDIVADIAMLTWAIVLLSRLP